MLLQLPSNSTNTLEHTQMIKLTQLMALAFVPLLVSSCTIEKRVHRKGFHVSSTLFNGKNTSIKKEEVTTNQENTVTEKLDYSSAPKESGESEESLIQMGSKRAHASNIVARVAFNVLLTSSIKRKMNSALPKEELTIKSEVPEQKTVTPMIQKSTSKDEKGSKRKTAIVTGASLLLMAVLAGISMPVLGTLTATLGLIGIFLLDLLVSFGIIKYYKPENPKLVKASGFLRILYTAFLGIAIGHHIAGSVAMFNKAWGIGLIFFGIHLITLGLMFDNAGGKKWVKYLIQSLLIIAGIGYIISYVGILVVPNPVSFEAAMEAIFILPMVLGEVFFALWMLLKGGKTATLQSAS